MKYRTDVYLPKKWIDSQEYAEGRDRCGVPEDIVFNVSSMGILTKKRPLV